MKETIGLYALLAFLLVFTASCAGSAEGKVAGINYPMKAGAVWEYQITRSNRPPKYNMRAVLTNLPQRRTNGMVVTPQRLVIQGGKPGTRIESFLLAEDASGLFGFVENKLYRTGFSPTYYAIKNPMRVGSTWESETSGLWLDESVGHPKRIVSTIESIDETISVPAGTFQRCIKIRANVYFQFRGRDVDIKIDRPVSMLSEFVSTDIEIDTGIESYIWFAPGVGLVKATYRQGNQESATVQLQAYKL